MTRDTFPYWPPTSPQRPAVIAGRQASLEVRYLYTEAVAPPLNGREIPILARPIPRVRRPDLPFSPEAQSAGQVGTNLYDLFMMTEQFTREQVTKKLRGG